MLGSLAAATAVVLLDALVRAMRERLPGATAERNLAAARAAYGLLDRAAA